MKPLLVRLLSALLCLSIAACSTLRVVPGWRDPPAPGSADSTRRLQVGDVVRVKTRTADEQVLFVTAIESDTLVGQPAGSAPPVRIPLDDIVQVERKEFDANRTAWLGAAVIVGIVALLYAALSRAAFFPSGAS